MEGVKKKFISKELNRSRVLLGEDVGIHEMEYGTRPRSAKSRRLRYGPGRGSGKRRNPDRGPKVTKIRKAGGDRGYDPDVPGGGPEEAVPADVPLPGSAGLEEFDYDVPEGPLAGDAPKVDVSDGGAPDLQMVNLNRGQDIGVSNEFSAFNVRGGLSNYALLSMHPRTHSRKFHSTYYPCAWIQGTLPADHYGQVLPWNYSTEVYGFLENAMPPYPPAIVAWTRPHGVVSIGGGINWLGFPKIVGYGSRNCLNAIFRHPPGAMFGIDANGGSETDFTTELYHNLNARPDTNLHWCYYNVTSHFDPESIGWETDARDAYGGFDLREWQKFNPLKYRDSDCVRMHRIRVSGNVVCPAYIFQHGAITLDPTVLMETLIADQQVVHPTIVVLLTLHHTNEDYRPGSGTQCYQSTAPMLSRFLRGYGRSLAVNNAGVPTAAAGRPDPNAIFHLPSPLGMEDYDGQYGSIVKDVSILAFEVLDMDKVGSPQYRTDLCQQRTIREEGFPDVEFLDVASFIRRDNASAPFVFDVDLGGVVARYKKDYVNWCYPDTDWKGVPDSTAYGFDHPPSPNRVEYMDEMLETNVLRVYAYSYYPTCPGNVTRDTTAAPSRQPAFLSYDTQLEFTEPLD